MKILLTTTSYQDTPGDHHQVLQDSGFEVVRARGPLNEAEMLDLIETSGGFDGLLNGDDEINVTVIDALLAAPTPLRVIAKYGIGLDSIDVDHATAKRIPVLFTPGVNHTTVAEHAFGLMIGLSKYFGMHLRETAAGRWTRKTGVELAGKTLGVVGLGRVGREVVPRGRAFGMDVIAYNRTWDEGFANQYGVTHCPTPQDVLEQADVVSLHLPLLPNTAEMVDAAMIGRMKDGAMIVNTSRGGLVVEADIVAACRCGKLHGYATDVLATEPMTRPHPFDGVENIFVTPHIGSRTIESVGRQAMRATKNLVNFLTGGDDYIQANEF
ncbi:MAG: phosphoglycerate dehydrogenase [Planctomycetota bacterium]